MSSGWRLRAEKQPATAARELEHETWADAWPQASRSYTTMHIYRGIPCDRIASSANESSSYYSSLYQQQPPVAQGINPKIALPHASHWLRRLKQLPTQRIHPAQTTPRDGIASLRPHIHHRNGARGKACHMPATWLPLMQASSAPSSRCTTSKARQAA